jgi:hypothetical protein
MVRSGYRTSEFWFTLVSFVFSGLFLLGVIGDSSYKEELIRDVSHAVESVILISGQIFLVYRYIKGRNDIKHIVEEEELEKIRLSKKPTTRTTRTHSKSRTSKTK